MASMVEISAAINLIDVKKQNLHKSFLHLQSQSPSSFNLHLNWADIDSYFTTLHSSIQSKFNLLQTLNPPPDPPTAPAPTDLKSFCQNSDGLGLTRLIALSPDPPSILSELVDAYRFAPDAPAMVLDAIVGFYSAGCKGAELRLFERGCLIMLEGLIRVNPVITVELKEKAMEMAVQWNQKKVFAVKAKEQSALGFLLLVGAYGLIDRFSIDDVMDCFLIVAAERHTVDLCRRIVPASHINDLIQKLIDKDMHVTAANFSIHLQKTNKFSPVGLLEERKLRSLRVIEEAHKNAKDLHACIDVTMKEIDTLKSIIECIEENHLQSEYPKDSVVELVNRLENELENNKQTLMNNLQSRKQPARAAVLKNQLQSRKQPARAAVLKNQLLSRKQPARAAVLKNQQQLRRQPARAAVLKTQLGAKSKMPETSKKPRLNKVQPTVESAAAAAMPIQNVKLAVQESRSQKSDLSPDHVGECHNSPLGSGPTGSNAPYASPMASLDGSTRANTGYDFYAQQLQPPSDCNSNGWISD